MKKPNDYPSEVCKTCMHRFRPKEEGTCKTCIEKGIQYRKKYWPPSTVDKRG